MQNDLHKELQFAVICTVILDLLLWILSLFITDFCLAVPLGLLIGSAGMLLNLLLLRRSILHAVYLGKTRNMKAYLLRCLIASAAMASGLLCDSVSAAATVLPFLYPKIIFGILSMHTNQQS